MIKNKYLLLKLCRPKQWIKNIFTLAPLIFSGEFLNTLSVTNSLFTFAMFCIASSATYVLNDYNDRHSDRQHPVKSKTRPIASGEVTLTEAKWIMGILYSTVFITWFFIPNVINVILIYLIINVLYTFYLKHQPVLDIFTIAIGFVLRVYAGAVTLSVPLSSWMFITTLSLALYLAAIKRRQELSNNGDDARIVLKHYTVGLVDKYAEISATSALLFYSLFVISDRPELVYSIPFVMFGIFRYWFVVEAENRGELPTDVIFFDTQLQITIIGWIATCGYSLIK
jgi:decaprenyl-phosphate phosphoribosyltransferase